VPTQRIPNKVGITVENKGCDCSGVRCTGLLNKYNIIYTFTPDIRCRIIAVNDIMFATYISRR